MGILNKEKEKNNAPGKHPGNNQGKVHLLMFWNKVASSAKAVGIFNKVKERAPVYSQDLASSQTTKRIIFQEVEMVIIQYVIDNCDYCRMQLQKFA